jgi:hypothetical protein
VKNNEPKVRREIKNQISETSGIKKNTVLRSITNTKVEQINVNTLAGNLSPLLFCFSDTPLNSITLSGLVFFFKFFTELSFIELKNEVFRVSHLLASLVSLPASVLI